MGVIRLVVLDVQNKREFIEVRYFQGQGRPHVSLVLAGIEATSHLCITALSTKGDCAGPALSCV